MLSYRYFLLFLSHTKMSECPSTYLDLKRNIIQKIWRIIGFHIKSIIYLGHIEK